MNLQVFHPAVARWFTHRFAQGPTEVQEAAWPAIRDKRSTLIAAPTGSGKTLAAFLAVIDTLIRDALETGLADETVVLYVSPLKALSNDIHKNLEIPLAGIRDSLLETGRPDVELRTAVRSGDTPPNERARMRRNPPHILVTTPESLYLLLTAESGRRMLGSVRTVIVDELHALAGNKRGAHLGLSLERLSALCLETTGEVPTRIGLSATQKPIDLMASFLTGASGSCTFVDTGHVRQRDLAIEVTDSELDAIMAAEVWAEVYDRLAELVAAHRTTLIFVNTRRLAERAARHLAERLGEDAVTAHHGSLARNHRLDAEQRLKRGALRALVATSSLELGIDIGDIDLVCQLGSPRSIATFLQRVGRSGHSRTATPKGRLFPLTRDDLAECAALLDAVQRGELDRISIPVAPLDVLAQQVVAEVAAREWREDELYELVRRAWHYRDLTREKFSEVIRMLAVGFSTRRGRRGAYLYRDAVHGRLRARRGARTTAITNGGAIPDQFDYDVVLQPQGHFIGTLNEDFAFESLPGDIFQLGNTSYRMLKIENGKVHVEDAHGQPPNIPFWFGEAPGRTDELSHAVSRLRSAMQKWLAATDVAGAQCWLEEGLGLPAAAARNLITYYAAAHSMLGLLPTQTTIVMERFFDETGDTHLVIHAPFGSRINRAWGLALRKRFCRKFNFELQAAALEDTLVLSLGPTHSFPLAEVARYLSSTGVRDLLVQALLDAPMFATHWRWNTNISLAVPRNRHGKRLPAQFQRSDAEDLAAVVFPDQLACLENIAGDREIPDHPLVEQTLADCLHQVMDIDGLVMVLQGIEDGSVAVVTRELPTPSPLTEEILGARPYAFLDDAPAEERRTLAVRLRHETADPGAEPGRLDTVAIVRICQEAWPSAASTDEVHDALQCLGFISATEAEDGRPSIRALDLPRRDWRPQLRILAEERRAACVDTGTGELLWVAAERLAELLGVFPMAEVMPPIEAYTDSGAPAHDSETALVEIIRGRLEALGPVTANQLGMPLGLPARRIEVALARLEGEGSVFRGRYSSDATTTEWCERRLLARIHRATLQRMRREIQPVAPAQFMRFLFHWQHLADPGDGQDTLAAVLDQLEGLSAPAAAWEADILPARLSYDPSDLDQLCLSGRYTWLRLEAPREPAGSDETRTRARPSSPVRATPISLIARARLTAWLTMSRRPEPGTLRLSADARKVADTLDRHGALFFDDILAASGLLHTQVEAALGELVSTAGLSSDSFAGLRALLVPAHRRPGFGRNRPRRRVGPGVAAAGRWTPQRPHGAGTESVIEDHAVETIARGLLRRYGVVFRRLLEREAHTPPWRDLLYVYRRLEARGEIRGGRFVDTFSGEQFALPEAVGLLRDKGRTETGTIVAVAATDPLNLTGIVTPGERVPAHLGYRIAYLDGIPAAAATGQGVRLLIECDPTIERALRDSLARDGARGTRATGS